MVVDVLYNESIEVLMAANHPLAQYDEIPWSKLIEYPQVVFKDGYGMQRLVQERFSRLGAKLQAVMELNTLEAFRGVVRQGELIALLPQSALVEASSDTTLAIRAIANLPFSLATPNNIVSTVSTSDSQLSRQVVLVTTQDRIQIPPIQYFCELVRQLEMEAANVLSNQKTICAQPSDHFDVKRSEER